MINRRGLLAASAALAVLATAGAAHADAVEDFYRGKTVTIVVPVGPGGGTAAYFEVVARHLGRFIPGEPTVITNFMPGGGGVKAMLYGAQVAPRDGTTLLTPPDSVAVAQLVSPEATYNSRAFTWLGTIAKTRAVLVMHKNSGVKTIEDLKAKETKIGAAGPGSSSQYDPTLANELIGTKMKVIVGYDGFGGSLKAMLGGELDGTTQNWQTWKGQKALFDDGTLVPVLQYGIEGEDRLPDIPERPFPDRVRHEAGGQGARQFPGIAGIGRPRPDRPRRRFRKIVSRRCGRRFRT